MSDKQQFIAIQEASAGNETVGDCWLRTATFPPDATLAQVYEWARGGTSGGKLIITADEKAQPQPNIPF